MNALLLRFLLLLTGCPRIIGIVALAPGFDAAFVPPMVRVALAGGLALALAPLLAPPAHGVLELTPQAYLVLLLSELALGAVIGFLLSCLLEAARLAGEIVDLQIGFRAGALYDPVSASNSSVLGRLWYLAAVVFFFTINGHHWLMTGLMHSFQVCPIGELVYNKTLASLAVDVIGAFFVMALQISAPVVAALILADVTMGLVGRSMPQMNLMLVGMPGKIMLGLGALALCSPLLANSFAEMLDQFHEYLAALLKAVGA